MAITNGYASLKEYKVKYYEGNTDDHHSDTDVENAIEDVSRLIDSLTWRRFYASTADETRYYTAADSARLFVDDDMYSVTSLHTDLNADRTYTDTWDTGDYDLLPVNAALDSQPYTWLEVAPLGDYVFPLSRNGVKVTGKFGYCAASSDAPRPIKRACMYGAKYLVQAQPGVTQTANTTLGTRTASDLEGDTIFTSMIDPYKRRV